MQVAGQRPQVAQAVCLVQYPLLAEEMVGKQVVQQQELLAVLVVLVVGQQLMVLLNTIQEALALLVRAMMVAEIMDFPQALTEWVAAEVLVRQQFE